MWRLAPYVLGALLSAFVAGYWTGNDPSAAHAATFAYRLLGLAPSQGKQDRLAIHPAAAQRDTVRIIQAVGEDHGTVIYRDGKGSIVFRNDPSARSTVAVKGVVFPAVPASGRAIRITPAPSIPPQREPSQKLMEGCEPALSPLASREASAFGGRCLASKETARGAAA